MRRLLSSLLFLLGLAPATGCKSEIVEKIEGFADRVCACKDEACALQVQKDYLTWQTENSSAKGSEKDRSRVEKALGRYSDCHRKLITEVQPGPSPTTDSAQDTMATDAMVKMRAFADEACACTDVACAQKVQGDYLKWHQANSKPGGSAEILKKIAAELERYSNCHRKLVGEEEAEPAPANEGAIAPAKSAPGAPAKSAPGEAAAAKADTAKPVQGTPQNPTKPEAPATP